VGILEDVTGMDLVTKLGLRRISDDEDGGDEFVLEVVLVVVLGCCCR